MKQHDKEKRVATEPRREEDRILYSHFCSDHPIIQETTKEHRQIVCKKIEKAEALAEKALDLLKSKVDWKVLLLLVGLFLASLGYISDNVSKNNAEIKTIVKESQNQMNDTVVNIHRRITDANDKRLAGIKEISESINNIENAQIKMDKRLEAVEQNLKSGFAAGAKANPK